MRSFKADLEAALSPYRLNGTHIFPNGACGICPAPFIAPRAYVHMLFKPCVELGEFTDLREVLSFSNGIMLFGTTLSVFGINADLSRDVERPQSFDILGPNAMEWVGRPKRTVFAFYDIDGTYVCFSEGAIELRSSSGELRAKYNQAPADFIISEFDRLAGLHDELGRPLTSDDNMLPWKTMSGFA